MLEVFGSMGLPSWIRGQFISIFMADVTKHMGIEAVKTTPHHFQANLFSPAHVIQTKILNYSMGSSCISSDSQTLQSFFIWV